jgi:hypothetical protein
MLTKAQLADALADPEQFAAYLASLPPQQVVGYACRTESCPIAQYLKVRFPDLLYVAVAHTIVWADDDPRSFDPRPQAATSGYHELPLVTIPAWAKTFIEHIDLRGKVDEAVTAQSASATLNEEFMSDTPVEAGSVRGCFEQALNLTSPPAERRVHVTGECIGTSGCRSSPLLRGRRLHGTADHRASPSRRMKPGPDISGHGQRKESGASSPQGSACRNWDECTASGITVRGWPRGGQESRA